MNSTARGNWSLITFVLLVLWKTAALGSPQASEAVGRAEGQTTHWFVVQPGYPGSTEDAEGFMARFSAYLEKKTDLPRLRGAYYNVPSEALAAIRSSAPAFSLVSLGFYLEHRRKLGMVPLLQSEPQDRFVIVAVDPAVNGPEALRGAKVAGGPLYEKAFLERVVFRDSAAVASWKAEPVLRSSRALRRLERGAYAAVVLTGREYTAFSALSRRKKLEIVLKSAYYPQTLVVAFASPPKEEKENREENRREKKAGEKSSGESSSTEGRPGSAPRDAEERSRARPGIPAGGVSSGNPPPSMVLRLSEEERLRLKQALETLAADGDGRELLETMGIRGFTAVRSDWLKGMEGMFDAQEEK